MTARRSRPKTWCFPSTECVNDKKSLQASNFLDVTSVEAPDDYTLVVITTKQPSAVLLERLNNRFIVSKEAVEKNGNQLDNYKIGTGAYKLTSWQRDGNLVLARNDDYWRGKPEIKEAIFKTVKNEAARVAGLLAGQSDAISNLPIEEIERVQKHPRTRVQKVPGFRMYFLAMNLTLKPFDNKLVRQAVNYSVDPQADHEIHFRWQWRPAQWSAEPQYDRLRSDDQTLSLILKRRANF